MCWLQVNLHTEGEEDRLSLVYAFISCDQQVCTSCAAWLATVTHAPWDSELSQQMNLSLHLCEKSGDMPGMFMKQFCINFVEGKPLKAVQS